MIAKSSEAKREDRRRRCGHPRAAGARDLIPNGNRYLTLTFIPAAMRAIQHNPEIRRWSLAPVRTDAAARRSVDEMNAALLTSDTVPEPGIHFVESLLGPRLPGWCLRKTRPSIAEAPYSLPADMPQPQPTG